MVVICRIQHVMSGIYVIGNIDYTRGCIQIFACMQADFYYLPRRTVPIRSQA